MSSEGLEALAALASAAPASETTSSDEARDQNRPDSTASGSTGTDGSIAAAASTLRAALSNPISGTAPASQTVTTGLEGLSTEQLQQLVAAAATNSASTNSNPFQGGITNLALLQGLQQQTGLQTRPQQPDSTVFAMQQLAMYQCLAQAQSLQQNAQLASGTLMRGGGPSMLEAAQTALALGGNGASSQAGVSASAAAVEQSSRQVIPAAAAAANQANAPVARQATPVQAKAAMPPPHMKRPSMPPSHHDAPPSPGASASVGSSNEDSGPFDAEGKKLQKRAANRRSAQLSRKRKKQFMEGLKEENDDLRRKEQILKSIPDLILVFDSTGKLWFVSKSVTRFLQFSADQLEGTSIWDRMCEDSVRLLKAGFMDSLAARQPDSDTAALGSGFWELRLVDRDGTYRVVTLNGVVHFAGERPECVCSIRPGEDPKAPQQDGAGGDRYKSLVQVLPQQSVVTCGGNKKNNQNQNAQPRRQRLQQPQNAGGGESAVRISDGGNTSGESESGSGSSDEMTDPSAQASAAEAAAST